MTIRRCERRERRERGAALVEMALVSTLLFLLVFGIIGYAYMMSFQQSLTQAAAEGARAGAVAMTDPAADAQAAVEDALGGFGVDCDSDGMECDVSPVAPCVNNADAECVTVTLRYAYRDNPLLPSMPGLGMTLPETVDYTAVAEVSG